MHLLKSIISILLIAATSKSDESRFATTLITSQLVNNGDKAKEINFTAHLPDAAFISNFSMLIGNEISVGQVKEKAEAQEAYARAKERGESAGLVDQSPRETNLFEISAHVGANEKVTFNLTYQEILKRVHGVYKHIINLQSHNLQKECDVEIRVQIMEEGTIEDVKVPKFGPRIGEKTNSELMKIESEPNVDVKNVVKDGVSIYYIVHKPKMESSNLTGQLVVLYDVKRDHGGGEIQVVNGYFVHFFAPDDLPRVPKYVVFILDKSGSMEGTKINQTKAAMHRVLRELNRGDYFNIIVFSDTVSRWKPKLVEAHGDNVEEAITYVNGQDANGGTNIIGALRDALQLLHTSELSASLSMIIFLTDGDPTVGETNIYVISRTITQENQKSNYIIHSIAFGDDVKLEFLQQLSSKNFGLARKVYEDSDADMQLTGFYQEISSPLLTNVTFKYLNESLDVNSLVHDQEHNYYQGGEMMSLGKLKDEPSAPKLKASVSARGASGPVNLDCRVNNLVCNQKVAIADSDTADYPCSTVDVPNPGAVTVSVSPPSTLGGFVERMWAYQTIKKLLKDAELEGSVVRRNETKKEALRLSLKYGFVTEVTSMVVIQRNTNTSSALSKSRSKRGKTGDSDQAMREPRGEDNKSAISKYLHPIFSLFLLSQFILCFEKL